MISEILTETWGMHLFESWKRVVDKALSSGMPMATWCRYHCVSLYRFNIWRARISNPNGFEEFMDRWRAMIERETNFSQPRWKTSIGNPEAEESAAVDLSRYAEEEAGVAVLAQGPETGGVVLELDPDQCIMVTLSLDDSELQSIEMEVA